jgi:serine protease Do
LLVGALTSALVVGNVLQGQPITAPAVPKELTSYRDIVKHVLPAVVSVESKPKPVAKGAKKAPQRQGHRELPEGVPEEFRRFFEDRGFGMDVPEDTPHHSFGSGFLIDSKGVVLTNYHVVSGTDRVEVQLKDGRKFTSTDIHGDRKNDLAIIRIDPKTPLPYLELGDSDGMEIGDRVLAVGAPFGLTGSVTAGIVSAKSRTGLTAERSVYEDYLQTDAAINPGNSGGPLVNLEGKVIGINTAIKSRSGGWQGVGLAISSNLAKDIVEQLLKGGVVHRGYLGVSVSELDPEAAARLGVPDNSGVVVARVMDGAPAEKAGLQAGDVITNVGGKTVKDGRELQHVVGHLPLKKPVDITIIRDGKSRVLTATILEQPENYGVPVRDEESPRRPRTDSEELSVDKVGMDVADLTADLAEKYGYKEGKEGVVISSVQPGGVASEAGLRGGMLIVKIDKKAVKSASGVRNTLQKASLDKGVLLQVEATPAQGGGTAYLVLKAETANK